MTRRILSLVVGTALVGAACSSATETEAAVEGVSAVTSSAAPTTTTTVPTTTSTIDYDRRAPVGVDELAFNIEGPPVTDPAGSGNGSPVTTIRGGGTVDVGAIYRGVVGGLGPNDPVADAVSDPPSVGPGIMPLTGLAGQVPDRPAAVVKIDNSPAARPQTGLNNADIVVEEEVEGGITRFAAIFHSQTTTVGPVRSGRTTDISVLGGLGTPLLMYSGANEVTNALIRAQDHVQNRSFETSSGYWRSSARRAPSNLYTDTGPHWASAEGGPPPAQFAFRPDGADVGGEPVGQFTVGFRANTVRWEWSGAAWLRRQGSSAHTVASGEQVSAANVIVVEAQEVATGMVDSGGATVPEFVWVGTGPATIFTEGKRIDGVWTRPTLTSVATFTTAGGEVIEVSPGRTWIEIVEVGAGMLTIG